jgi:hypothetical protein
VLARWLGMVPDWTILDTPKSPSLMVPSESSKMFPPLTSRWIWWLSCKYCNPRTVSRKTNRMCSCIGGMDGVEEGREGGGGFEDEALLLLLVVASVLPSCTDSPAAPVAALRFRLADDLCRCCCCCLQWA